jgi:hypothetical protein
LGRSLVASEVGLGFKSLVPSDLLVSRREAEAGGLAGGLVDEAVSLRDLLTSFMTGRFAVVGGGLSLLLVEEVLTLGAMLLRDWVAEAPELGLGDAVGPSRVSRLEAVAKRA